MLQILSVSPYKMRDLILNFLVESVKKILRFFGFKTPKELSFNRQWTGDAKDESLKGYKQDYKDFLKEKTVLESLKEGFKTFADFFKNSLRS